MVFTVSGHHKNLESVGKTIRSNTVILCIRIFLLKNIHYTRGGISKQLVTLDYSFLLNDFQREREREKTVCFSELLIIINSYFLLISTDFELRYTDLSQLSPGG